MSRRKRTTRNAMGTRYRSNFEVGFASDLIKRGLSFDYEPDSYEFVPNTTTYTPDFYIPEYNFYIETKGFFTSEDRTKHLTFRKQHPSIDIRFVFMNVNTKINKRSKTSYGDWCNKYGFKFSNRVIDDEWLRGEDDDK